MYQSTPTYGPRRNHLGTYRAVAAQSAVDHASPHRLVALLYAGLAAEIAAARGAVARGDTAEKNRAVGQAVRILVEGLAAPLDYANGGEIAARLGALYDYLIRRLTHANLHHDDAALAECARLTATLQEAWEGIAGQVARPAAA